MRRPLGALAAASLTLVGCANDAEHAAHDEGRVIAITMRDNRFDPSTVSVKRGETVTFRFSNRGDLTHEALVGDEEAQMAHADEMENSKTGDDMGDMHHEGADDAITVEPGKSMDMTRTFDEGGEVIIGCHVPGHYESGMKATLTVS